ncbi:unnamed protein product [Cylicocyclus nassatus]|uniref:RRM domain-containing protein n=1 Tax=Cylicocyclus nassatus TaxID=53992 RepID=A0AA36DSA2_CYLNA|nr:unnamed protein product [Cylicocyclus nassatus]
MTHSTRMAFTGMDLLGHYLSYQMSPVSSPLISVDQVRELMLRLKLLNLNMSAQIVDTNLQVQNNVPALLPSPITQQIDSFGVENSQLPQGEGYISEDHDSISRKVFVGGLPQDISKSSLLRKFSAYGRVRLDFPSEPTHPPRTRKIDRKLSTSGYVFLIYDTEAAVFNLLRDCTFFEGNYFLPFREDSLCLKYAQVRPWQLTSIAYIPDMNAVIDPRLTVFIGGVPRPLTSGELAMLLERNYGPLLYCEIDVDPELFYPKGAARAVFASYSSYVRAIQNRFLHIPNVEFNKRTVEIKPYMMDDILCDECLKETSVHFCKSCMQYYCEACSTKMDHYVNLHIEETTQSPKSSLDGDFTLTNNLFGQMAECSRSDIFPTP